MIAFLLSHRALANHRRRFGELVADHNRMPSPRLEQRPMACAIEGETGPLSQCTRLAERREDDVGIDGGLLSGALARVRKRLRQTRTTVGSPQASPLARRLC